MTLLHVYFTLRNQQAFHRLLDRDRSTGQASQSTSASKSWTRKSIASALEVNAYDHLGRTVLHLACSSIDPASLEYARMLLAHPSLNVNLADKENHWTALHRAMYAGNIEAAIMLLKRTDTDTSLKDLEGYTAFDLYNSTVRTANPTSLDDGHAELFTWGANRNAALGLGDNNDRTHPDHVVIPKKDPSLRTLEERFQPVKVRDVRMSKLHTVILTNEPRDNVRLCGFGSGGRLGPFSHTLYAPTPFTLSSNSIVSVALGQDHTLALTSAGEVVSWGLNRFAQLGYVIEPDQGGSADESIQTTPRKISHLKKEFLKGIAACKTASACWSDSDVWTWGTNGGQLGYSKTSSPVQILPRKASIITQPIRGIAMLEAAMMCLFISGEVICVWNGGVTKINFPAHAFPADISTVYRPPQAVRGSAITKVVCCDDVFAALSSNGEVFTFSRPTPTEGEGGVLSAHASGRSQVKPQRLWALRRQFSSVRDVDIGGDGAVIICTQSGHVYVRSRNLRGSTTISGTKPFKFHRVAHAQRVVAVCANSTGAFGALRVDYRPPPVSVTGRHFAADMGAIAPYLSNVSAGQDLNLALGAANLDADEDLEDSLILDNIGKVATLIAVLCGLSPDIGNKHGADLLVQLNSNFEILAHRVVLAARCVPLREVLSNGRALSDKPSKVSVTFDPRQSNGSSAPPVLHFIGITPLSFLILLHYLYTDEVLAIWDRRIGSFFGAQFATLGLSVTQVKADLSALADLLRLPHLTSALQFVGKRVAKPSASADFQWLFDQAQQQQLLGIPRRDVREDPLAPDVALHLADEVVYTHSTVLRARSEFFAAFFDDPEWTAQREDDAGVIDVQMRHFNWRVMRFVLAFVCFGDETWFETLEFLHNVDELLEFLFLVISAANELLLTRLVLLCSHIVLKYLNAYNACYLLTEAIHFNATDLVDRIQSYMAANIEMLLESRILDDLDTRVVRKMSEHARLEQAAQLPVSRSEKLGLAALEKHKEWLALQDIPGPLVPTQKLRSGKDSPRMSPPGSFKKGAGVGAREQLKLYSYSYSPSASPVLHPSLPSNALPPGDEIFAMDDTDGEPSLKPIALRASGGEETLFTVTGKPGWKKGPTTPRTDLKAIMAEAETDKRQAHARAFDGRGSTPGASMPLVPGGVTIAPMNAQVSLGAGPSRQQGLTPERWRSDTPPTPRCTPSDLAMIPKSEPLAGSVPSHVSSAVRQGTTPASPSPSRPIMGPVIIPIRQTPSGSGSTSTGGSSRKTSLGGAWTLPPVQPIAAPTTMTTTPLSFAEIQKLQEMQGTTLMANVKRSLRDIQEEERARQQEADFLRWWAAEEERVRVEMSGLAEGGRQKQNNSNAVGGKAKSQKGKAVRTEARSEGNLGSSTGAKQRESRGH